MKSLEFVINIRGGMKVLTGYTANESTDQLCLSHPLIKINFLSHEKRSHMGVDCNSASNVRNKH